MSSAASCISKLIARFFFILAVAIALFVGSGLWKDLRDPLLSQEDAPLPNGTTKAAPKPAAIGNPNTVVDKDGEPCSLDGRSIVVKHLKEWRRMGCDCSLNPHDYEGVHELQAICAYVSEEEFSTDRNDMEVVLPVLTLLVGPADALTKLATQRVQEECGTQDRFDTYEVGDGNSSDVRCFELVDATAAANIRDPDVLGGLEPQARSYAIRTVGPSSVVSVAASYDSVQVPRFQPLIKQLNDAIGATHD